MNGLITPDLHLAPHHDSERPTKITPKYWLAPVLFTLGEASLYQKKVLLNTSLNGNNHRPLLDKVIEAAGFDPFDEASLPAPLRGASNPIGIYRSLQLTLRENSRDYLLYRPRKGAKGVALFFQDGADRWALTEHGVAVAASIRHYFVDPKKGKWHETGSTNPVPTDPREKTWMPESTVTGMWLKGFLTPANYTRLVEKVMMDPRAKKERESGEIMDHIAKYFESIIRRDTFRDCLMKGDPPTFRLLTKYVLRRCISAYRSYGQDCLMRHQRSALSDLERKNGNVIGTHALEADTFDLAVQESRDDVLGESTFQTVIVDKNTARAMELSMAWDQGIERLKDEAFKMHKPGASDRYENIFEGLLDGISQKELAEQEGVKQTRAANLMQECRAAVKKQASASRDAKTLLSYLTSDPWSTVENMLDEIPECRQVVRGRKTMLILGDTDLQFLLDELVNRGRIKFLNGSYAATGLGESFVTEYIDAEVSGDFFPRLSL
jgi:hypothetical protein